MTDSTRDIVIVAPLKREFILSSINRRFILLSTATEGRLYSGT